MDEAQDKQARSIFLSHSREDKPAIPVLTVSPLAHLEKHGHHDRRDDELADTVPAILPRPEIGAQ